MLDLKPQRPVPQTLRDFVNHIATIVLGVLIAIGFEQTVEYLHHEHQRRQLEAELRSEAAINMQYALRNVAYSEFHLHAYLGQYAELDLAAQEHRTPRLLPDPPPSAYPSRKPAQSAWLIAQQNATLGLLPHDEAQRYARVYSVAAYLAASFDEKNRTLQALPWTQFSVIKDPLTLEHHSLGRAQFDMAQLSPQALVAFRAGLVDAIKAFMDFRMLNLYLYGIEWASLHGSLEDDAMIKIQLDTWPVYDRGGKAALLAKYPLPEEAKDEVQIPKVPEEAP